MANFSRSVWKIYTEQKNCSLTMYVQNMHLCSARILVTYPDRLVTLIWFLVIICFHSVTFYMLLFFYMDVVASVTNIRYRHKSIFSWQSNRDFKLLDFSEQWIWEEMWWDRMEVRLEPISFETENKDSLTKEKQQACSKQRSRLERISAQGGAGEPSRQPGLPDKGPVFGGAQCRTAQPPRHQQPLKVWPQISASCPSTGWAGKLQAGTRWKVEAALGEEERGGMRLRGRFH